MDDEVEIIVGKHHPKIVHAADVDNNAVDTLFHLGITNDAKNLRELGIKYKQLNYAGSSCSLYMFMYIHV